MIIRVYGFTGFVSANTRARYYEATTERNETVGRHPGEGLKKPGKGPNPEGRP